jgi:menaquinone-dependent protoporphyrinogen oxidase
MSRILVAYATKHGSTAEIAQAIGRMLAGRGHGVDVLEAAVVADLQGYDAVVLGSAVYMGRWQKDGIELLKRHAATLRSRPTWLFSSGPTGGTGDADTAVHEATAAPMSVPAGKDVARWAGEIGARGHATFAGRIGDDMTGLLERWMPRGDWRDFEVIEAWARSIADALEASAVPA